MLIRRDVLTDTVRPIVDCLFTLLISLKLMCLLTLPMLDFKPDGAGVSSPLIFCVFGRCLLLFDVVIAPALRFRSERKESLSMAKLRKASSKSTSSRKDGVAPGSCGIARIVALLLLLSVPSRGIVLNCFDEEFESLEKRCQESLVELRDNGLGDSMIDDRSASESSSIVSCNPPAPLLPL